MRSTWRPAAPAGLATRVPFRLLRGHAKGPLDLREVLPTVDGTDGGARAQRQKLLQDGVRQRLDGAIHRLGGGYDIAPDLLEFARSPPWEHRVIHRVDVDRRAFPGVPRCAGDADCPRPIPLMELLRPTLIPKGQVAEGGRHRLAIAEGAGHVGVRQLVDNGLEALPRHAILDHERAIGHEPTSRAVCLAVPDNEPL